MRIGLIAALRHSEEGNLRAALPLAGRSVIASNRVPTTA
jgi:hypothetical protein